MHWKITRGEFDLKKLFLVICLLTLILTGCGSSDKKTGTTEGTKESSTENPFSELDTTGFRVCYDIHMTQNLIFLPNYFGEVYGVGNKYEDAIDEWGVLNYSYAESKLLEVEQAIESADNSYYPDDIAFVKEALGLLYLDKAEYDKAYDYLIDSYVTMNEVWGEKKTTGTPEAYYSTAVSLALCHYYYDIGDFDTCMKELQDLKDQNTETTSVSAPMLDIQLFVEYIMNDIEANIDKDCGRYIDAYNLYVENSKKCSEYIKNSNDKTFGYILMINACTQLGDICGLLSYNEEFKNSTDDFYEAALKYADKFDGELKDKYRSEILMKQGKFMFNFPEKHDQAMDIVDESIDIQERLKSEGKTSPDIINAYITFAEVYGFVENNTDKAQEYYGKADDIAKEIYGKNHPLTAAVYESMGRYYANRTDDIDKAIEFYNNCVEIYKNLLVENSSKIAFIYYHLAGCYKLKGDDIKSDEYLEKANTIFDALGIELAKSN